jgi:transposase
VFGAAAAASSGRSGGPRGFQKKFPQRIAEIRQRYSDREVQIFFQDETRFGQQGSLTRVWAPKGSRPRAVRQTQYQYVYVIGAACPHTGQAEALVAPYLDTAMLNRFLEQFSQALPPQVQAVLVWDGAGYHRAKQLQVPPNITLLQLPPYAPELNPIENLWHYLKSHHWSNRAYDDYEALLHAACEAWGKVCLTPKNIRSLCAAPYAVNS